MNDKADLSAPSLPSDSAGRPPRQLWDERYASLSPGARQEPTDFVAWCLPRLPAGGRALDVAGGAGRHSLALARHGWQVDAVDISPQGIRLAQQRVAEAGLGARIRLIVADIERPWLPHGRYGLILVSFFLHRPLFSLIKERLAPGGWLIYETFTLDCLAEAGQKPSTDRRLPRRELLLEPDELLAAFADFEVLFYKKGHHHDRATARLLARKPV